MDRELNAAFPGSGLASGGRQPLVSVVIAAYNAAPTIESTCLSVLGQTYRSLEVIVVDDGSTDDTSKLVETLAVSDPRLRLIRQENLGVAAARNRAIVAASGEFVAPLDADDVWDSTKIARQVQRLQEAGPDAGMTYCWWAWIDVNGNMLDRSPLWQIEGHVLECLVEVNFTGCASVPMYRRSCLEKVGGYDVGLRDKGCQGCEDWDLALRVAEGYRVVAVPALLVGYRRRTGSMSAECDTMWRSQRVITAALAARNPEMSREVLQRSDGQFALHLAGVSFWCRDYLGACRWALRARPLTLVLTIVPHVAWMLARRLFRGGSLGPRILPENGRFEDLDLPEPLIRYDRIYARYWRARQRE
jgi:GT2 family glycosyltransferase